MNIDITRLRNRIDKVLNIDEEISFTEEELKNTEIRRLENVHVVGYIKRNSLDEYDINLTIKGTMILACAITLEDVKHDFEANIDDSLDKILEENNKKIQNTIDILPIIWENILMEIPMRVVSEGAKYSKTEGNGWKLITDEEN